MCVQCFYSEGMLIVHDCRSTIVAVAVGVVTLYHLLRVCEGRRGGGEQSSCTSSWWCCLEPHPVCILTYIYIALYWKLKFEVLSELQCIALAHTYFIIVQCLLPKPKAWVPSNSTGIFLGIKWYNKLIREENAGHNLPEDIFKEDQPFPWQRNRTVELEMTSSKPVSERPVLKERLAEVILLPLLLSSTYIMFIFND